MSALGDTIRAGEAKEAAKDVTGKLTKEVLKSHNFGKNLLVTSVLSTVGNLIEGESPGRAIAQGALAGIKFGVIGAVLPGFFGTQIAFQVGKALGGLYFSLNRRGRELRTIRQDKNNFNWNFVDTEQAYTMRQAAVQAIQASKLNARSALGGEARLMHLGIPGRW